MTTLSLIYHIVIISIGIGVGCTLVYGIWNFIKTMLK